MDVFSPAPVTMTPTPRRLGPSETARVFALLARQNPEPRTELVYRTPFELLVAVVLSAQSTDRMVNRVSEELFARAPTPEALLALPPAELERLLSRLGLYRTKARYLRSIARLLLERHGGEVPRERAALEALPGVGRKTANVILNTLWGDPVVAVDTHVARVARRLGLARGRTPAAVERELTARIPPRRLLHAHHWLVLHGRHVCRARRPLCETCVLRALCPSAPPARQRPTVRPAR
jgi:endonuclease-3